MKKSEKLGNGKVIKNEDIRSISVFELLKMPMKNENNSFRNVSPDDDFDIFMNNIKIYKGVDMEDFAPLLVLHQTENGGDNIIKLKIKEVPEFDEKMDSEYNGDETVNFQIVKKKNIPALYLFQMFMKYGIDYESVFHSGSDLKLETLMGFSRYIL